MSHLKSTFLGAALAVGFGAMAVEPAIPVDPKIEARVNEIVSKMTLDEKVGQMCEIEVSLLGVPGAQTFTFNPDAANHFFDTYKVGSVLNVPMGQAQTPEVWRGVIKDIQDASMKYIGIPDIFGLDQIHGTTYIAGGTLFPQEVNMAASFNRPLVRRIGEISSYETRAVSVPWNYAPVMDIGREARWSRSWESFGEDPYINSAMAHELVLGYQGDDPNNIGKYHVASCLKHYMGYGAPRSGKDRTPAIISPNELREKFLSPSARRLKPVHFRLWSTRVRSTAYLPMPTASC